MMNPADLTEIDLQTPHGSITVQLALYDAITVCDPIMSVGRAIHRLQNEEGSYPIIKKNGGPITKSLGDVKPIWVGRYFSKPEGRGYIIIYEDDLNSVELTDDFTDVDVYHNIDD